MDKTEVTWPQLPNGSLMLGVVVAYIALLLALSWRADSETPKAGRSMARGIGYALSLSVLCTSWTYFGAIGLAMRQGWNFLPNSLGPILALTVLWPAWRRIAVAAKRENVSSIADFIASRYGKSRPLGALIACVAIIGALPYIALQLMMLSRATAIVVGARETPAFITPLICAALAALAILFGARRPTLTQHNRGLARVVAVESIVKLLALVIVATLAITLLVRAPVEVDWGALARPPTIDASFIIATVLCTVTMFTLPRVFHLGFVTLTDLDDLRVGRWLFPIYMVIWAATIVPIAAAGAALGLGDPNTVVLSLPLLHGGSAIAAFAFLGGFSAGAAMVMVEAIALSAMISNELILPWLARHWSAVGRDIGAFIVDVRRAAIVGILLLAYIYFSRMPDDADLPRLGFASLTASAQLIPALFGAVFWRRGHARGAFWGIACGMGIWSATIAAPQLGLTGHDAARSGIWGASSPDILFNLGVCLSLACNLAIYIGVSLASPTQLLDRIQADSFVAGPAPTSVGRQDHLGGTIGDLRALLERFLGTEEAGQGLANISKAEGRLLADHEPVTPLMARTAERILAGAIGASTARNVIALTLSDNDRSATDIRQILDEAAHAVQFSRDIVQAALNGIDQGISVVDRDLRLVAWNQRYIELFGYPRTEVYVGKSLEELIGSSEMRFGMSPDERAKLVEQRLGPIRRRETQMFERAFVNGRILRVVGRPLATGEFVTSFTDITEIRAAERAMSQMNEALEMRVQERTRELMRVNAALSEAKALAERVMSAQNRFVAAASHDLLQPMHAARLFLGAAVESLDEGNSLARLLTRADLSIESADRLLKALLNLSRIEVGGVAPEISAFELGTLLSSLKQEFEPIADGKGLELIVAPTSYWASSNKDLLRSVLQNLLSNAIRYTPSGRVLVCVRREGANLRVEVRDNGPGIEDRAQELIFQEFTQLSEASAHNGGIGLGLAIARRICAALDHRLTVRSRPNKGSTFAVTVPRAQTPARPRKAARNQGAISGMQILCVEDQPEILEAQRLLLMQWGASVDTAQSAAEALGHSAHFDAIVADYHLGEGMDGLALLSAMGDRSRSRLLLTANASDDLWVEAAAAGVSVLKKPVPPAALRAFLRQSMISSPRGQG